MMRVPSVLTIAGSDSGGGAGIQADIKTITALGLYASSVITAVTAQNTLGVQMVRPVTPELLAAQLDSVFSDLMPQAVKIGMLGTKGAILTVEDRIKYYSPAHIVLDPVMVSTSGKSLLDEQALAALSENLIPLASLVTPNIPEAEVLLGGITIQSREDMQKAALRLSGYYHVPILLKGGHLSSGACDLLCIGETIHWYSAPRIANPNSHGTGCTLSSAVACGLAEDISLEQSIARAKHYLSGALNAGLDLGNGNGPLYHAWNINSENR